jgi:hypothetical protein
VVPKQAQTPLKQVRNTYKAGFSASEQRSEKGMTGFFNSLRSSRKKGEAMIHSATLTSSGTKWALLINSR